MAVLVNADREFKKGRPKNYIPDKTIRKISQAFIKGENVERFVKIITNEEAAKNDYNLSPSRYVSTGAEAEVLPLDEVVVLLQEAEEERAEVDRALDKVLKELGCGGWRDE